MEPHPIHFEESSDWAISTLGPLGKLTVHDCRNRERYNGRRHRQCRAVAEQCASWSLDEMCYCATRVHGFRFIALAISLVRHAAPRHTPTAERGLRSAFGNRSGLFRPPGAPNKELARVANKSPTGRSGAPRSSSLCMAMAGYRRAPREWRNSGDSRTIGTGERARVWESAAPCPPAAMMLPCSSSRRRRTDRNFSRDGCTNAG
jgi:hypothetical protein